MAVTRISRHGFHDDRFQVRGELRIEHARRNRLCSRHEVGEGGQSQIFGNPERPIQRKRLAKRYPQRIDIALNLVGTEPQ